MTPLFLKEMLLMSFVHISPKFLLTFFHLWKLWDLEWNLQSVCVVLICVWLHNMSLYRWSLWWSWQIYLSVLLLFFCFCFCFFGSTCFLHTDIADYEPMPSWSCMWFLTGGSLGRTTVVCPQAHNLSLVWWILALRYLVWSCDRVNPATMEKFQWWLHASVKSLLSFCWKSPQCIVWSCAVDSHCGEIINRNV